MNEKGGGYGENEILFDLAGGNFYDTLWLAIKLYRMRHRLDARRVDRAASRRGHR